MDQVETATFEHVSVSYRLPENLINSSGQLQQNKVSYVLTCSVCLPFPEEFLTPNQI